MAYDPFEEETKKPGRTLPLDDNERMVVQNFFDTQPKRRAAYLKQLGFELNPENDNEYRPIGSEGSFAEIDPGFEAYTKPGSIQKFAEEFAKDVGDITWDLAEGALVAKTGAAAGALGAGLGAAGGPLGATAGSLLGLFTGGVAGKAGSEALKEYAGDIYLDESIPADAKLVGVQALLSGAAPLIAKGVGAAGKEGMRKFLQMRKDAIVNAAKAAGGGVTPELLEKAGKNPEMFTPEAVKDSTERLTSEYKRIFGVAPDKAITAKSTRQMGGVLGDAVRPLNEAADREMAILSANPEANWSVEEITAPMKRTAEKLTNKFSLNEDEKAALKYLRGKIGEVQDKAAIPDAPGKYRPLTFMEGREVLKVLQDDAFNQEVPGSKFLAQVAGAKNLRGLADEKAARLGSPLPQINAKRSEILATFEEAKSALKPTSITAAFLGNDNISKLNIRNTLSKVDALAGTKLSESIETGALQQAVENIYKNPQAFGSGRVKPSMLAGAVKQGVVGAALGGGAGAPIGMSLPGAVVGGVGGAVRGALNAADLSQPEKVIPMIGKLSSKIAALDSPATPGNLLQQALATGSQQGTAQAAGRSDMVSGKPPQPTEPPKPYDPFED